MRRCSRGDAALALGWVGTPQMVPTLRSHLGAEQARRDREYLAGGGSWDRRIPSQYGYVGFESHVAWRVATSGNRVYSENSQGRARHMANDRFDKFTERARKVLTLA